MEDGEGEGGRRVTGSVFRGRDSDRTTYFSEGFRLSVPLVRVVFILLDGAEEEIDLGNGDLG